MKLNLFILTGLILTLTPHTWTAIAREGSTDKKEIIYKNPDAPIDDRVGDLLSRMTLEEKVLQLSQYVLGNNDNINNIGETV